MEEVDLQNLTDEQLLAEKEKLKSFSIMNAFLIGFLIGIVAFGIFFGAKFFLMLIPLFIVHRLINDPKSKRFNRINAILKERNLQ